MSNAAIRLRDFMNLKKANSGMTSYAAAPLMWLHGISARAHAPIWMDIKIPA